MLGGGNVFGQRAADALNRGADFLANIVVRLDRTLLAANAFASHYLACCDQETVRFVDTTTGQPCLQPLVHPTWVYLAEFSDDGKLVLTFGKDSTARVWDVQTGKLLGAQPGTDDVIATLRPGNREVLMTD